MEAPTKSGGTRKSRQGRDLIGRLSTLPPVEFLKKHNPLRRRRGRPQLGFDQPLQEIKRLALPLRPAPPSLSMRLFVRVRPVGEWIIGRFTAVARTTRTKTLAVADRFGAMAGRAGDRVQRVFAPVALTAHAAIVRVLDLRRSPAVRWCEQKLNMLAERLPSLQPATWQPSQTAALMVRTQRVRRALVGLVVCEWTALLGLVLMLTALAATGRIWDRTSVNACGLILCALSLTALALQAWQQRLVGAWQSMDLFICADCGGLRNFSPSLACPGCGTDEPPAFPGQVPVPWRRWPALVSPLAAGAPALVAGMLILSSKLV